MGADVWLISALVDAVAWPAVCGGVLAQVSIDTGIAGQMLVAACVVAALLRGYCAIVQDQRCHFTAARWAMRLGALVAFGYSLRSAAIMLGIDRAAVRSAAA